MRAVERPKKRGLHTHIYIHTQLYLLSPLRIRCASFSVAYLVKPGLVQTRTNKLSLTMCLFYYFALKLILPEEYRCDPCIF